MDYLQVLETGKNFIPVINSDTLLESLQLSQFMLELCLRAKKKKQKKTKFHILTIYLLEILVWENLEELKS